VKFSKNRSGYSPFGKIYWKVPNFDDFGAVSLYLLSRRVTCQQTCYSGHVARVCFVLVTAINCRIRQRRRRRSALSGVLSPDLTTLFNLYVIVNISGSTWREIKIYDNVRRMWPRTEFDLDLVASKVDRLMSVPHRSQKTDTYVGRDVTW